MKKYIFNLPFHVPFNIFLYIMIIMFMIIIKDQDACYYFQLKPFSTLLFLKNIFPISNYKMVLK